MRRIAAFLASLLLLACATAQSAPGEKWVTSWAASVQGPYPVGNPSAQPDLSLVLPKPAQAARGKSEAEADFPFATASTINGNDRWPDVLEHFWR